VDAIRDLSVGFLGNAEENVVDKVETLPGLVNFNRDHVYPRFMLLQHTTVSFTY
jgi:hypothetical protein